MSLLAALVLVVPPAASPAPPAAMRLKGLDRLYFREVGRADALSAPPAVAALLPLTLDGSRRVPPSKEPAADGSDEQRLGKEDFPLPLPSWPRQLVLRQVGDFTHPRISEIWLALYDGGQRSDVWHFQAMP